MPLPKCFRYLPCFPKKQNAETEICREDQDRYQQNQICKAVAIVLNGYDKEIAAASVGGGCTAETVDVWVTQFRPPFFEDGMNCPPALIDWWMQEMSRKQLSESNQRSGCGC